MTTELALKSLEHLVGRWTYEATHHAMPGVVVHGTATFEWLEGERFLIHRSRTDHPDFPDSISIIGFAERDRVDPGARAAPAHVGEKPPLTMHYFDSRGVSRVYEATVDAETWRIWRYAAGFSQRYTGTFVDDGNTIVGRWQLCQDDSHWNDDLDITYRRRT